MRSGASKSPPLSSNPDPSPCLSSSSNHSPASDDSSSRCEGLDLLVLAVIEIFGDRVFEKERIGRSGGGEAAAKNGRNEAREEEFAGGLKRKGNRRESTMPSRFKDSVLQPWKRSTRRRLSAGKRLDSGLLAPRSMLIRVHRKIQMGALLFASLAC
ncbi:uncharacterized protein LOC122053227 [Zingiber officinale]|uniref:uncharacterized protein LOC122053227 n=1 Tax=Zingiber officinale TaxID=94328 RepID=UPI001C4BE54E|nr:uncharacterized protein LOC122053227 [Zingiber officinale]